MTPVKLAFGGMNATALMKNARGRKGLKKMTMIDADKLKEEIRKIKKCFTSENCDYVTGYLSAMSVVEGMIAYLSEPPYEIPQGGNFFEDKTESGLLEDY